MNYSSPETWHDLDQSGQQDNWLKYTEFYSNQEGRATTCVFDWPEGLDPSLVQSMHMHVNYRGIRHNAQRWYGALRQNTGNWVVVGDNETASNQQGDMVFEIPGSPAAYVRDGEIQLAYRTDEKINASALNYATIELEINETAVFSHHVFIPIVQVQTGEPPVITPTPFQPVEDASKRGTAQMNRLGQGARRDGTIEPVASVPSQDERGSARGSSLNARLGPEGPGAWFRKLLG